MLCFNQRGMNHRSLVSFYLMIACGLNVLVCHPAQAQIFWGNSSRPIASHQAKQSFALRSIKPVLLSAMPSLYALSANTTVTLSDSQDMDTQTRLINGGRLVAIQPDAANFSICPVADRLSFFESSLPTVQTPSIVVPEPGTLAFVICLGVGGIALRRSKRRDRRVTSLRTIRA